MKRKHKIPNRLFIKLSLLILKRLRPLLLLLLLLLLPLLLNITSANDLKNIVNPTANDCVNEMFYESN